MFGSRVLRLASAGFVGLLLVAALSAVAASNTVPASLLSDTSRAITPNDLKPTQCAGINVSNLIVGTGQATINGTNGNDLILGTSGNETINGRNGADCIVGGGGNDTLNGDNGNDVILGGPGADTINGGNGTDDCWGVAGTTFSNCETTHIYTP
jgi:Ca2+-binding RTX toxin-like protein